ncbi:pilin [Candidatus Uhrbacteria bacterium]|nr:pilin [Candidatus Uhrbacteria bacterium]
MTPRFRVGLSVAALALAAGVGLGVPHASHAALGDALKSGLDSAAPADLRPESGATSDLPTLIGNIIGGLMSLVGAILFVYLLYGGFRWMTAGGDEKKVGEARDVIKNAVIGLVIIVLAYAIATFVIDQVSKATSASQQAAPEQTTP